MRIAVVAALPVLLASVVSARAESVAALIERQSQEFSDASASGDAAIIAKYLDDRVIFMNETGEIGNKKDIVDGTQPTSKNILRKLHVTNRAEATSRYLRLTLTGNAGAREGR